MFLCAGNFLFSLGMTGTKVAVSGFLNPFGRSAILDGYPDPILPKKENFSSDDQISVLHPKLRTINFSLRGSIILPLYELPSGLKPNEIKTAVIRVSYNARGSIFRVYKVSPSPPLYYKSQ